MVQGAGRPGQPNPGQPSIFGNGGPSVAQMPSFTPVTRGGPQPAAPAQPTAPQPAPAAFNPQPQTFADPAAPQPAQPQAFSGQPPQPQAQPQAYAAPQPAAPQPAAPSTEVPDLGAVDPGFPDSIFGDVQLGASLEQAPAPLMEEPAADAAFPEEDASFSELAAPDLDAPGLAAPATPASAFQAAPTAFDPASHPAEAYAAPQPDAFTAQQPQAYATPQLDPFAAQQPQQPEAYAPQPMPGAEDPSMYAQPGVQQGVPYGHVPPADPNRQLQTVDPNYGQPPEVALGDPRVGMEGMPQDFMDAGSDADFMDASVAAAETGGFKSKVMGTLKGRSTVMVASALLGAIALGGALAYAYKQSGGGIGSGDAPIVTADASPVRAAPDAPGGKEFPNKNKLIYDRLTNGATPESERLVPRQEDVAVPALPPATATAGLPAPVATAGPAADDGGPRKVRTMVVNPDGSVQAPAAVASANQAIAGATDQANNAIAQANGAVAQANGMMAQPNMMPVPSIQPPAAAPQQVAAAPAAAAPAAAASSYVVQLGSTKSQTDALANFADAQQKYPSLLGSYQPLVRKTDLGAKGTWYRLQVGPMADKDSAYRLCGQLKSKGHGDCLVMAQ
ncbi:MAG: SPOR domain-containing protein [Pseudomonadota bacterium]